MPGESNASHKLTAREVAEIRSAYSLGGHTQEALGRRFGVSQVQVGRIVRGVSWAEVCH